MELASGPASRSREERAAFWNRIQAEWHVYERARRNDWLISCWTKITENYDDKLIAFKYSGDRFGVGVTIRYGALKRLFQDQLASLDRDKSFGVAT